MLVFVRETVLFCVKKVDFAIETLTVFRGDGANVGFAQSAIVTAADFCVSEARFECGRDLEVSAHFENTVSGRRNGQSFLQPGEMALDISARAVLHRRPGADVLAGDGD